MVYYNPYITWYYNSLYTLNNRGFFIVHFRKNLNFVEMGSPSTVKQLKIHNSTEDRCDSVQGG